MPAVSVTSSAWPKASPSLPKSRCDFVAEPLRQPGRVQHGRGRRDAAANGSAAGRA